MSRKLKMTAYWDTETKKNGPQLGDIVDIRSEILDDDGTIDFWIVEYKGECYDVYPYEVEEVNKNEQA